MNELRSTTRTQVAVVGGGPAGLMLSHLLHLAGVETVVVDTRSHGTIATTHRAGILEKDSVSMLVDSGVDRVLTDGHRHAGISLRFEGENHRIDFEDLVGASCWLYPQTDVFLDLHARRTADGGDLRYGVTDTEVLDVTGTPRVRYTDAEGARHEVTADFVVGSDGSRSMCRRLVEGADRSFREYPFAWFGFLVEAPASAPELVYTRSERGFVLLSQRTESVQRMYFQCDAGEDANAWSEDRIWSEMTARVAGHDGFELKTGPIIERSILPFRSFVQTPMRHGNLLLAGDAAHTVPPTGAKGLNLALSDVRVLAPRLARAVAGDPGALDDYTEVALARVWKAQYFSYWMTSLLHRVEDESEFDTRRRLAELRSITESRHGAAYLAECYTGWPTT